MADTTKLAQRMKLKDGTLASQSPKKNIGSRKRKNTSFFAGYGVNSDTEVQDENQLTSSNSGKADKTGRHQNQLDTSSGNPPSKKHKPPQSSTSTNADLWNYFQRVPRAPLGSQPSSFQNTTVNPLEARQFLKESKDPSHEPKSISTPITSANSTPITSANSVANDEGSGQTIREQRRFSVHELSGELASTSTCNKVDESLVDSKAESEQTSILTSTDSKKLFVQAVAVPKRDNRGAEVSVEHVLDLHVVEQKSKDAEWPVNDELQNLKRSNGYQAQLKSSRSVLEHFRYSKPRPANPSQTQVDTHAINNLTEPVNTLLDSQSPLVVDTTSTESIVPVEKTVQDVDNSQSVELQEATDIQAGDGEQTSQPEPTQSPRRRRLMRASDLKLKKYKEVSESSGDEDDKASKESKKTKLTKTRVSKTKPEPEPELEPEPEEEEKEEEEEPEPKHIVASRKFMMSFFGVPAPISSTLRDSPKASEDSKETDEDPTSLESIQLRPITKPTLKTYSKAKTGSPKSKKKSNKRDPFSDSDRSNSDNSDESDDDISDFKKVEKPDPNQKSITSMFSKDTSRSASSFISTVRPRRKRVLTPASRIILSGGLSNISNTCYLNSVLQTLRNTVECTRGLFEIQEKMIEFEKVMQSEVKVSEYQRSLFEHALQIFRILDSREISDEVNRSDEKSIYPTNVIRTLHQGDSLFNTSDQQDAAEFLFYIISQFDDILKAVIQLGQESESKAMEIKDWQPINDLFQVGSQTVTNCQRCSSVSVNDDRGIDLTVQIDTESSDLIRDLEWGISTTMKMEHMKDDNQRFCDKCNSKEDAHVYHYFTSLPKLMILRLQRYNFKEGAVKIQNGVSCTETLNFSKWMSKDYKGPDSNYELCAIIVHRGRVITSGHYYVYIKKYVEIETEIIEPDGESRFEKKSFEWLKYNDSCVNPASKEEMIRIFSGNVNPQSRTSSSNNKDVSISDNGQTSETLEVEKNEGIGSNMFIDDDMATPYVYMYRRVD